MIDALFRYAPTEVSPPGDTLRDLMEERAITQAELSRRLGRPAQAVNEIMAGKKEITEDTALELERVLQVPAQFWMARESRYREYLARLRAANEHKEHLPWLDLFPIKALQGMGFLPQGRLTTAFKEQLVEPMLRFFGVASPEGWAAQYDGMQAQFRRTKPNKQTDDAAITAWLRMGELQSAKLRTADYSAPALTAAIPSLLALSTEPADALRPQLVQLCSEVGVALALVPALPGTHVSGVARWLGDKPLIQLSLLGKSGDAF
jgi:HTH-type transcriptional regulator / antitoxin HigA